MEMARRQRRAIFQYAAYRNAVCRILHCKRRLFAHQKAAFCKVLSVMVLGVALLMTNQNLSLVHYLRQ